MADENNPNSNSDASVTDTLETKKQRAPRRPKVATDMMGGIAGTKPPRGRRKRGEQPADANEIRIAGRLTAKGAKSKGRRKSQPTQPEQTITAAVSATDEMADLLQLEEENKKLRKSLAEKLRAENAELRKRLGLA